MLIKRVILCNLPLSIKGYCYADDVGDKICVLNCRYTHEDNINSYQHEILHANDFGSLNVDMLESIRHK